MATSLASWAQRAAAGFAAVSSASGLASVRGVVPPLLAVTALGKVNACAAAAGVAYTDGAVRGYKTVPRRVRKARRKAFSRELRSLVKFAERYDPERKARNTLWQTLHMMGWSHNKDEVITDGVTATATLQHKFVAYEIAPSGQYTVPESGDGIVLGEELQAKHDALVAKGFKVVWIPQDDWSAALNSTNQHEARRDLFLDLTLDQAPFEPRYIA